MHKWKKLASVSSNHTLNVCAENSKTDRRRNRSLCTKFHSKKRLLKVRVNEKEREREIKQATPSNHFNYNYLQEARRQKSDFHLSDWIVEMKMRFIALSKRIAFDITFTISFNTFYTEYICVLICLLGVMFAHVMGHWLCIKRQNNNTLLATLNSSDTSIKNGKALSRVAIIGRAKAAQAARYGGVQGSRQDQRLTQGWAVGLLSNSKLGSPTASLGPKNNVVSHPCQEDKWENRFKATMDFQERYEVFILFFLIYRLLRQVAF